ncbi:LacI family DNA-binding transcriptional regulator [Acetatifactor aquisgranensis]|uniref:LacI family DNA-binding transcriptional regulator n=1 Tax=Acetatifactor aquisgranensis TaxID=2941233 RepID=UPI00203E1B1F|nr:LacI family DNA-binding transcriptional regulator [Acetatifactor aquisgranensis]MCI8542426.1 LacI family transcriptional regulator [Lachnospiraceae bacterium]
MTLDEMARELGVSKSTVSRALSGKGRIGEKTRERIVAYAGQQGMYLSRESDGGGKTGNLGVVFPADVYENANSYFQDCMLGVCEAASLMDFNVLIATETISDISGIQMLAEQKKVDGIILTRNMENDRALRYLTDIHFPVGVTGQCDEKEVIQVDTDNEAACEELTALLIGKGFSKFALVVEDLSYRVNRSRYQGFGNALLKSGIPGERQAYYVGALQVALLDAIISDMLAKKVECIICGDDMVCTKIVSRLQAEGYRIPRDVAVASLYNSSNLNCFTPQITAINISARKIGNMIGKQMIRCLRGQDYEKKVIMEHEILLRRSTDRIYTSVRI